MSVASTVYSQFIELLYLVSLCFLVLILFFHFSLRQGGCMLMDY